MRQTLVLDQTYAPHRVVPWHRAISLLLGDKVDVIDEWEDRVRSPSREVALPAVIRLRRKLPRGARQIRFNRRNVLVRDGYRCQYCGAQPPKRDLTFDHVVPRSRGGGTHFENIVTACKPCNGKKGSRALEDSGLTLARVPSAPTWLPIVPGADLEGDVPEAWEPFVAHLRRDE